MTSLSMIDDSISWLEKMVAEKINYCRDFMKNEELLNEFSDFLKNTDPALLINDDQKKAFWINIYNALTIYFIICNGLKNNMKETENFFSGQQIKIGHHYFSLDNIEHQILRKKTNELLKEQYLVDLQPQLFDNRIHFVLNCGGISCPPIMYINEQMIDQQLNNAKNNFVSDNFMVDEEHKTVECSQIFEWYKNDFKNEFLLNVLYKNYTIKCMPYNWQF